MDGSTERLLESVAIAFGEYLKKQHKATLDGRHSKIPTIERELEAFPPDNGVAHLTTPTIEQELEAKGNTPEDMGISQIIPFLEEHGRHCTCDHNDNFGQGICERAIYFLKHLLPDTKQTLEQELEAGLKLLLDGKRWAHGASRPCTAIFLPEALYKELRYAGRDKAVVFVNPKSGSYNPAIDFHGIPVKSTNDTKITYHCGD